ncbi:MAG: hypothetical protein ACXVB1_14245 [Pseudobdellovibrionaceae bacterium]
MNISKIFLINTFLLPSFVFANAKVIGNGGVGIQCNKSIELFDIYEGRTLNQQIPKEKNISYQEQALSFANHLTQITGGNEQFRDNIQDIISSLRFLPKDVGLNLTNDVGNFIYPKNCRFVQILNYKTDGFIYVDTELWQRLSETQKTAAILHEAIYKYFRTPDYLVGQVADGDRDSVRTRRVVAYLIAGNSLMPVHTLTGDSAKAVWFCKNSKPSDLTTIFYAYENPGNTIIEFSFLNGSRMISNTSISESSPFKEFGSVEGINSIVDSDLRVSIQSLSTRLGDDRFTIDISNGVSNIHQELECRK